MKNERYHIHSSNVDILTGVKNVEGNIVAKYIIEAGVGSLVRHRLETYNLIKALWWLWNCRVDNITIHWKTLTVKGN